MGEIIPHKASSLKKKNIPTVSMHEEDDDTGTERRGSERYIYIYIYIYTCMYIFICSNV
jgi:hypothetical protein